MGWMVKIVFVKDLCNRCKSGLINQASAKNALLALLVVGRSFEIRGVFRH